MLIDGNPTQLERIASMAKRHGVEVTVILDFIHVLEYLWKAAYCCRGEGSEAAERWVGARALRILRGD